MTSIKLTKVLTRKLLPTSRRILTTHCFRRNSSFGNWWKVSPGIFLARLFWHFGTQQWSLFGMLWTFTRVASLWWQDGCCAIKANCLHLILTGSKPSPYLPPCFFSRFLTLHCTPPPECFEQAINKEEVTFINWKRLGHALIIVNIILIWQTLVDKFTCKNYRLCSEFFFRNYI